MDHIGPGSILHYDSMRSGHVVHTRTIREAAAYFQEADPHTSLTETAIRTLLRTGAVPSARVGRKYLVTIEALEAYLEGSTGPEKPVKVPPRKWQIKWGRVLSAKGNKIIPCRHLVFAL